MALIDLFNELAEKDIQLWLDGDNLQFSAPEGAMTDAIIQKIKAQKSAIIEFLRQHQQPTERLSHAPEAPDYPASYAQQRFWLLQQLDPQSTAYHIKGQVKISGKLSIEKLASAFTQLVRKHKILRTAYVQKAGKLRQVITDTLPELEINDSTPSKSKKSAPFDLNAGEVIRASLFQSAPDEWLLDLSIHHIACDGLSLAKLTHELMGHYFAPVTSSDSTTLQYIDYCVWQESSDNSLSLTYWQDQLKDTPVLRLPADYRHENNDDRAGFCSIRLNSEQKALLNTLATDNQTTLFSILLTNYALFLNKATGQDDFAIGTPISGRILPETEDMLGCFINSLAIRFNFDDVSTGIQLIEQCKISLSAAFEHQSIAFEQVVSSLNIKESVNTPPVFQTLISLDPVASTAVEVDGIKIEPQVSTEIEAQFDLKLNIKEDDGLTIVFEYKKNLFKETTMGRFSQLFVALIDNLCKKPDSDICSLLSSEQVSLTFLDEDEFNDTQAPLTPICIDVLFDKQASNTPDNIAISSTHSQLTYSQLKVQSEQFAQALINEGVSPGDIIAIEIERSTNLTIALLATLKTGAAYLPIEPEAPESRKQQIIDQANPKLIITESTHWQAFTTLSPTTRSNERFRAPDKTPNQLINVIFTSGSTGNPKGVMVSHKAIHNRIHWMQQQFQLQANDVVLQKTPIGFDVSVWELFWPIITGARCHFLPPEDHKDPDAIIQTIKKEKVSHLHFVPSMLTPFLQGLKQDLPSVRHIYCSGEALTQPQVDQCYKRLPAIDLFNLYGPTEAAVDVSCYHCKPNDTHASVPIGKPIDNIQLHILDENLKPTAFGLAGELYIGGMGLAEGYINREDLTRQQFINNPLSNHPGTKLYKTGDWVRMSFDNQLLYLGRMDSQVKIRGQRIELAEVEQNLIQCLNIQQAVVKVLPHPTTSENSLVAYLPIAMTKGLRQEINQTLSQAMQPQFYVQMDTWPLTPSGKIDRKRLPEPAWGSTNQPPYRAAETATESRLVSIWSSAMGIEKVGIDDNFFDLGGHSLKAMEIAGLIQEQFECQIPLKELMINPTIAHIAKSIDQALAAQSIFSSNTETSEEDQDSFII